MLSRQQWWEITLLIMGVVVGLVFGQARIEWARQKTMNTASEYTKSIPIDFNLNNGIGVFRVSMDKEEKTLLVIFNGGGVEIDSEGKVKKYTLNCPKKFRKGE